MVKVETDSATGRQILVRTTEDNREGFSFVEVIDRVDSLPSDFELNEQFRKNVFYMTTHDGVKVGFVNRGILEEIQRVANEELLELFEIKEAENILQFKYNLDFDSRNTRLDELGLKLRDKSKLQGVKGWRNEKYAVWVGKKPYVLVERALSGVLGIITYGVHVNGYMFDEHTQEIKFWIPRRSKDKPTWPYLLDNVIAGGLGYPYGIEETLYKESIEEANLDKESIQKNIRAGGVVSYFYFPKGNIRDNFYNESSAIVGEVEYIYDLRFDSNMKPSPNDGEVDSFNLLDLQQTIDALVNNEFKPNCGLIMLEFLIRYGYINAENEPNYLKIINRMHRSFPFPTLN
ncbi:uncharacterized protein GVI51_M00143 [Nakaseomyces glabratus]|uniref:Nudix hydrolase domain-containing protein n=2 Tax=Candida glabrata TaxID=5478 RepID=Q6FK89_CANGA|nr:uncharacterized protein CAGL0M00242g [Nakaseomyces glabratus]KAH7578665.1 protein of unknown function (DUF4743) [Nakaseomyces glabratus]KAH7579286.1 protein of unknown function (DUF4743) [Nakaseomyces glabratus]KAH7579912.1 protein of unknown function (DUF4743) [Nakaseomyces glabratus]KAH7593535.1 protein of unknown function (DUF4743) [Nakaseomyces glabratus]KAH7595972.1 protein of unknown function (DUF4743) [Nakaseomyces glabratus]|eukprot:XP_449355.1 uncharacterized protein CAGL0M00242g [[Candida] glabrata]